MREIWVCLGAGLNVCKGCGYRNPPEGFESTDKVEERGCHIRRIPIAQYLPEPSELPEKAPQMLHTQTQTNL
jgi:hypothetical protein